MASNTFGKHFCVTTFGESHGEAIGVVIDGCPAGLSLNIQMIQQALDERAPGKTPWTSPRKEPDQLKLLSGLFEGVTTGAPITFLIPNRDARPEAYLPLKDVYRPGHANYTYLKKYGIFDWRGGGRASARETAARVAAGAVAKQLLALKEIEVFAYLQQVGPVQVKSVSLDARRSSPIFCPDPASEKAMISHLEEVMKEGDSVGGIVGFTTRSMPIGLGDPVYEKLEANLAKAMLSIPASKGFEIGSGFQGALMWGSEHNDSFITKETNHAGGVLGGISNGEPICGRVAFKPASTILKPQETLTKEGAPITVSTAKNGRHDPCIAIRAVPVVEAMLALTLADAYLINSTSRTLNEVSV